MSRYRSNMLDLIVLSVHPISLSWSVSSTLRSSCSKITTSTVSSRSRSWRHSRAWLLCQSKTMKFLIPFSSELSLFIGSQMWQRLMVMPWPIQTNRRHDNNSSTSTRSCRHQPSSLPRSKRRHMVMSPKKIGSYKSRITDYKQRKMPKRLRASWVTSRSSQLHKIRKLMSLTQSGARNSRRSSFQQSMS